MVNKLRRNFRNFLFATLLFLTGTPAFASHIVGMDMYYTWITGNVYKITIVAYGDCGPMSRAAYSTLSYATPEVCVYDDTLLLGTLTLAIQPPDSGTLINQICPLYTDSTNCTNSASTLTGITKFVYEVIDTLPYASSKWIFRYNGANGSASSAGRAAAITNISLPANTFTSLADTLDNTVYHNTSPLLADVTNYYFGINETNFYTPVGLDVDGDSLVYSLISGETVPTSSSAPTCMPVSATTYSTGYSATTPVSATSFIFDPSSGQMVFYPTMAQRSLVVYNIREYRHGVFVGSSQREMTVLVLPERMSTPFGGYSSTTNGRLADTTHLVLCTTDGSFTVSMGPREADSTQNIFVTPSGLPTGAVFSVSGDSTNHPHCALSWTTMGTTPGVYIFYLNYRDSACPIMGNNTIAYSILINPIDSCLESVQPISKSSFNFKTYPNPSEGSFTVSFPPLESAMTLTITDIAGRTISSRELAKNTSSCNLEIATKGIYLIKLSGEGGSYMDKVVVW